MIRPRLLAAALVAPTLLLAGMPGATGAAYPERIPLPDDWQPEGIATAGPTFYSGSLWDGDIYRGDLRSGKGKVFIDVEDRQAAGLKASRRHGLLFVAGAFTGDAYVYDLRTGAEVAAFDLGEGMVNDVAVTRTAAYFTDSFAPSIYKVPVKRDGSLGAPRTITVTGPAGSAEPGTFGLNGIQATPNGKKLIVAHSALSKLFRVNPRTGASREIEVSGGTLENLDGILRVGKRIWVVENFSNQLVKVRAADNWTRATVKRVVTHPLFQVPTTVARHGKRLVVVNAKFDLGFPPPVGPGAPPGTPFEAIQLKP